MPRYVLIADHSPDLCPAGNGRTRARMMQGLDPENVAKLTNELSMEIVHGPLHLDPTHRTIAIIEAPAIEAVTRFVIDSGMFQWNTVEVSPVTPIEEMMPMILESPIIFD